MGVVALNILFLFAFVQQVILGRPFGPEPVADSILYIGTGIMLLVLFFLFSIKLKTRITEAGIFYRLYPFQLKEIKIEWSELRDAYMRDYNSFFEYGGWGLRSGTEKTGKAVNTSASSGRGLQLQFKDGKRLLIGTRKPDTMAQLIENIIASGKINRGI